MTTAPGAGLVHPWHPVLVHFPIASWVLGYLLHVLLALSIDPLARMGLDARMLVTLCYWVGAATGLGAIALGVIDFLRLPDAAPVQVAVFRHMAWMVTAWLLFLTAALWRSRAEAEAGAGLGLLALETVALVCLLAGGREAGRLVYRYRLGSALEAKHTHAR